MDNFTEELALMIRHKAIIQITSTDEPYAELKKELGKLLDDENYREVLQSNTKKISHDVEKTLSDYTSLIIKNMN